ncbi:MAG: hypothetical protein IPJ07_04265 [Acidobacteria bacterium]|nr:hypothetical protein [Acidobacteriota bacterium]
MNHKLLFDNRGTVEVVDLSGTKTELTEELWGVEGLAWSAEGSEIWFTASKIGEAMAVYGVSPSVKLREVLRVPSDLWLHDINRDGRVLLTRFKHTVDLVGLAPGETLERNLTWVDVGSMNDLSLTANFGFARRKIVCM